MRIGGPDRISRMSLPAATNAVAQALPAGVNAIAPAGMTADALAALGPRAASAFERLLSGATNGITPGSLGKAVKKSRQARRHHKARRAGKAHRAHRKGKHGGPGKARRKGHVRKHHGPRTQSQPTQPPVQQTPDTQPQTPQTNTGTPNPSGLPPAGNVGPGDPNGPTRADNGDFKQMQAKLDSLGIHKADISALAKKYNVPENLIMGVMMRESKGNPNDRSGVGATGLMQLMPQTARSLGVKNIHDPKQNLEGGVKYLSQMLNRYHGDTSKALAAYNAGPGRVDRAGGVPHIKETQDYVRLITGNLRNAQNAFSGWN